MNSTPAAPSSEPPRGDQRPRIWSAPPSALSEGDRVAGLSAAAGLVLDDWQRFVLDQGLGRREDRMWSAFEVALIVSRQNGKGSILEALELAALFLDDFGVELILHSAHVGAAVARAALARGFRTRVLMRPNANRANVAGLEVEPVEGDMRDAESMTRALASTRYLFHVAADYRLWARDPSEIERNNLMGARATMQAALNAGVERVVYTSSVAALKPGNGKAVDETSRHTPQSAIGAYKRSKLVAEREVERMVAEEGLPAVIVAPSTPIGPRDIKPTPTGRIIVEAASGRMPAFVDTGLNLVHVDDVAQGHLAALDRGKIGENYILGGADVSLQAMLAQIAQLTGRKAPKIKLPRGPLFPLAYGAEALARLTGKEPMLTADALRMSRYHMFFSSAKAEAELGYHARPYIQGLTDAIAWFGANGYLQ